MNTQPEKKQRILIVEDEKYLRELYVEILEDEGYKVDAAADGEEGYLAMLKGGYDLVLLDIMLPRMDGLKILEKLNKETPPQKPNGTIIVLSNLGQDAFVSESKKLGVKGYMIKSDYTPDLVVKEIKKYLAEA